METKLHDGGIMKFVNRLELPNTVYSKRGKFDVTLGTSYVIVGRNDFD